MSTPNQYSRRLFLQRAAVGTREVLGQMACLGNVAEASSAPPARRRPRDSARRRRY